jgi:hypothetical protein
MPPIRLSDNELSAVLAAERPLDVRVRNAFLQQVADELAPCDVVGPGIVHRVVDNGSRSCDARVFQRLCEPPGASSFAQKGNGETLGIQ